jgi:7-cyano-7-deazaguanine synthase
MAERTRAVVLFSGGLDSTTCLAMAQDAGHDVFALTVNYGQRHRVEIDAARRLARLMGVARHVEIDVDLRLFGGSALTADIAVPKHDRVEDLAADIPVTYVPARNTIMLSYALAWAEVLEARDIYIGVNALDYSGYPDCRPEFIRSFETMANLATRAGTTGRAPVRIQTPLMDLRKSEIIRAGVALGVDYGKTHSCYDPAPDGRACGRCDSCLLRKKGFEEAGVPDPTPYAEEEG